MSPSSSETVSPQEVLACLRIHWRSLAIPAVVLAAVALVYAVVRPATWEAHQALMVRDEATGSIDRPGKFEQLDEMKAVQETILELIRSQTVLSGALAAVGPDSTFAGGASWPTREAIDDLRTRVKLTPPRGAEFGKTEIFYLEVDAESPQRAVALTAAICDQVRDRSQQIRDQKAGSLIAELGKTVDLARTDLANTTEKLTQIESHVGSDLGELRLLNEMGGGDSPLRRSVNEIELELRQARQAIDANQELIALLEASKDDPKSLVAAPNRLLEAQPVLRRLKDGLVDAQLRSSQLAGNMSSKHPLVIAARNSEQEIIGHVRVELDSAIRGVQAELRLSQERADNLRSQLAATKRRLEAVAGMRADYANLIAARNHRVEVLKTAEQQFAEARASQAGARAASVITPIDAPVASAYPVGPGKAAIVLGGGLGGLVLGLGYVFLTVQPSKSIPAVAGQTEAAEKPSVDYPVLHGQSTAAAERAIYPQNLSLKQALHKVVLAG